MKLTNPILITINNTLHIKADNLEPVEVDSSCVKEFRRYAYLKYSETMEADSFAEIDETINTKGINISELSDRIDVREETTHDKSDVIKTYKAFLLPSKEDKIVIFSQNDKSSTELLKEWASTKDFNWIYKFEMNTNVRNTLIKLLISVRDMDTKTHDSVELVKLIPTHLIPLDILEFFAKEITERKERIKKIEEFTLLLEK